MKVFFTNFFLFIASYTQLNQENKSHQSHLLTHRIMDYTFNEDSLTEYEKVLRKMFCRKGKKKDGLSNMIKIYDSIGKPLDDVSFNFYILDFSNEILDSTATNMANDLHWFHLLAKYFSRPRRWHKRQRLGLHQDSESFAACRSQSWFVHFTTCLVL